MPTIRPREDRPWGYTKENLQAIVEAARRVVRAADEFMPENPEPVCEYMPDLIDEIDHIGDGPMVPSPPPPKE